MNPERQNTRRQRPRWAVLISGRGSNLAALLELREQIDLRLVVSSRPDAVGLLRAQRAGVATELVPLLTGTRKIDWARLISRLDECGVTHVFLAGFMRLVPPELIERFSPGRIVNLHPSLLPAYPGLNSIERAHADGAAIGCTVHEVIEEVDAGKRLLQRQTLSSEEVKMTALERAEFLLHVDEQRLVREVVLKMSSNAASVSNLGKKDL